MNQEAENIDVGIIDEPLIRSNPHSWFKVIWDGLFAYREDLIPEGEEQYDRIWDDITTAMAWISEDVLINADLNESERVVELIKANSREVVRRRLAEARLRILTKAMKDAEERLVTHLTDNIEAVFEELPDIDDARSILLDALEESGKLKPEDFGRP